MKDIVRHNPERKLSDAVEYNGVVYLAGQVAEELNVGMKEQTEDVLRQIDALLAKCGTSKSRIRQCDGLRERHEAQAADGYSVARVGRSEQPTGTCDRAGAARLFGYAGRDHVHRGEVRSTSLPA